MIKIKDKIATAIEMTIMTLVFKVSPPYLSIFTAFFIIDWFYKKIKSFSLTLVVKTFLLQLYKIEDGMEVSYL